MKRTLLSLLAAAGITATASGALAAPVKFSGTMIVEQTTSACGILPYIEQGTLFHVSVRPANLGTNGPSTGVVLTSGFKVTFEDVIISSFKLATGYLDSTFKSMTATHAHIVEDLTLTIEHEFLARMRLVSQRPATLTDTTPFVTMRLQIQKFANVPSCTVTAWVAAALDKPVP
ncbi:MAG: hypothetical protein KDK89_01545 [Alphaproteobacteria bacterium]|nr:hypothetical protein [Alphaproteobacteria bacterium]